MKNIILVLITICSLQVVSSQNIDQATISKIKVKLLGAEKLYEQGEYMATLKKIKEIEAISGGMKSAKIQNLKVKSYLGYEMYKQAKKELNLLYEMNPDEDIINDIASYESRIDDGLKEIKARKERELAKKLALKEKFSKIALKASQKFKTADYLLVKHNDKWGFIDKTGTVVIGFKYEYTKDFSEGLAPVIFNGKWGYIDKSGEVVIPFKYQNAYGFKEGLANVKLNNRWYFINTKGEIF